MCIGVVLAFLLDFRLKICHCDPMLEEIIASLLFMAALYILSRFIDRDTFHKDMVADERLQRIEDRNHELASRIHQLDKALTEFNADLVVLNHKIESES